MGFLRHIGTLMWKHGIVRRRKFINTFIDFIAPLLLFIVMFVFRNSIKTDLAADVADTRAILTETEVLQLTVDAMGPPIVVYSPETEFTSTIMDKAGQSLHLERLNHYPDERDKGYYGTSNESEVKRFIGKMSTADAVVLFKDVGSNEWPSSLEYSIRMKQDFMIDKYTPDEFLPHRMFGIEYLHFMRVQWAVDSAYINLQSGQDKDMFQELSLQEFPFYKSNSGVAMILVTVLLSICSCLSLVVTYVCVVNRIVTEKASGIHELMKMSGLSIDTINFSHYLNVLPVALVFAIVVTLLIKVTDTPLIPQTGFGWIFLLLFLYINTLIALAFAFSYLLRTTDFVPMAAIGTYILFCVPPFMLTYKIGPEQYFLGLLPHVPMFWFWTAVASVERKGQGIGFSELSSISFGRIPLFGVFIYMVAQIILFHLLACYLARVWPGKHGQGLPWNFCWKRCFRDKNEVQPEDEAIELMDQDQRFFEQKNAHQTPGIQVDHVTKRFKKFTAVNDLTVDIYENEITVLLGHNGAGKTTLMNIITGMTNATKGRVFVKGKDTVTQQSEVYKHLGLCPQQNMYFSDLTLQEHIMFFTMLKKGSLKEARQSARKTAARLGLESKLGVKWPDMSGGMQRRAQLTLAMAGDADVLILDEPTSGLDVKTRRDLWDLLLGLRGSRTVLLTTHFMEEADALGDRVLAMHAGRLRCAATPMHLKRAAGLGYRLSLTTAGPPNVEPITQLVQKHVPEATVMNETPNSISYTLPSSAQKNFSSLFTELESRRANLGIDNIGVGVTTLEEVFLKLCSDVTNVGRDETDGYMSSSQKQRLTRIPLYKRQIAILLKRQFRFILHRKWMFLLLQLIIPYIALSLLTVMMNNENVEQKSRLKMDLDMYSNEPYRKVLYNLDMTNDSGLSFRAKEPDYPGVNFERSNGDPANVVADIGRKSMVEYSKYFVAIEINGTEPKILYTTTVRHAAPVALNMLSNLLLKQYSRDNTKNKIRTYNYPVKDIPFTKKQVPPKGVHNTFMWGVFVGILTCTTFIHCVNLPCRERESGARMQHIMSGCPAVLYWLVTLLFHIMLALLIILPIIFILLIYEKDATTNQSDFLGSLFVALLVGTLPVFAFLYLTSFYFGEKYCGLFNILLVVIAGFIFNMFQYTLDFAGSSLGAVEGAIYKCMTSVAWALYPPFTFVRTIVLAGYIAHMNAMCKVSKELCPNIDLQVPGWEKEDSKSCCDGLTPKCYFCSQNSAIVYNVLYMFAQFLLFMIVVVLMQAGAFNIIVNRCYNRSYKPPQNTTTDPIVEAEKKYVEREIAKPAKQIKLDTMLVNNIHKRYAKCRKKNAINAVKGVTFSVKKGECFGILGVNGAGKSSIFKVLTTEESATLGSVFSSGQFLKFCNAKYLHSLSYCPQFGGVDNFLTGQQNLQLILTLRGFKEKDVNADTASWISLVGLEKYKARRVEAYSGGCARRLSAVSTLCGGAGLNLLDEPTAGVDVAARRRLWAALDRALRDRRSIIITSHSMDEMEALCSRIAIIVGGRVRALGSPVQLRAVHAVGYALVFKLKPPNTEEGKKVVEALKQKMSLKFECALKDEHKTILRYHVKEMVPYSELFKSLEHFSAEFKEIIEDYSVSETTLEDVFLSFANEQAEPQTV